MKLYEFCIVASNKPEDGDEPKYRYISGRRMARSEEDLRKAILLENGKLAHAFPMSRIEVFVRPF